jgi:hypothetical protein
MRNFLKTIIFAFVLIATGACEEDIDPKVSANGFALRAPDVQPSLVLLPANDANTVATLSWDKSDNGGMTTVSAYTIEVAPSGTNFANAITANNGNNVTTADRTYTLSVGELNSIVNQFPGYQCGVETAVDVRVKSTLGGSFYNAFIQYSTNIITLNVTPYSSSLPIMAFSADGVITDATPRLATSGVLNTDYEGYMWLTPGSYKFYQPNSCGDFGEATIYGDDDSGSFNTLAVNGSGYVVSTAGFYLVRADTATSTYSVRPTTWSVFGTGKQLPLANLAMTYDQTSKLWKATISLTPGYGIKFRSNGNLFILGKFLASTAGTIAYAGETLSYVPNSTDLVSLPINELAVPGARPNPRVYVPYDITLDLNSPRDYKYTITLHP